MFEASAGALRILDSPASRVLNCASDRMVPRAWRTAGQRVIWTFHKVSNLLFERHRADAGVL
jgi:hypothetical protein